MHLRGSISIPKTNPKGPTRPKQSKRPRAEPELKAVDTAVALNCDTTGAIQLLNGIQPGTGLDQRVGRRVSMVMMKARLQAAVTAGTGVDQFCRYLVVLDHQPNGAALAINDVILGGTTSQVNLSNQVRFEILRDKRVYLNASGEPGSAAVIEFSIALNRDTQYNSGSAGTVADIATNSLYLIVLGSIAAGATAGAVAGSVRVRYYDE